MVVKWFDVKFMSFDLTFGVAGGADRQSDRR